MAKQVCGNDEHDRDWPPAAIARVSWPAGRFVPSLACDACLLRLVRWYVRGDEGEQHAMLIEPLT